MNGKLLNYTYFMMAILMIAPSVMLGMHSTESKIKLNRAERKAWMLEARKKVEQELKKNPKIEIDQIDVTDIFETSGTKRKAPIVEEEDAEEQDAPKRQKRSNEGSLKEEAAINTELMSDENDENSNNTQAKIDHSNFNRFKHKENVTIDEENVTYSCPKPECLYKTECSVYATSELDKFKERIRAHYYHKRCPSTKNTDRWQKSIAEGQENPGKGRTFCHTCKKYCKNINSHRKTKIHLNKIRLLKLKKKNKKALSTVDFHKSGGFYE